MGCGGEEGGRTTACSKCDAGLREEEEEERLPSSRLGTQTKAPVITLRPCVCVKCGWKVVGCVGLAMEAL